MGPNSQGLVELAEYHDVHLLNVEISDNTNQVAISITGMKENVNMALQEVDLVSE